MIYLLIPYFLIAAFLHWKFCWGRADVGLEERLWTTLFWPLLVIAVLLFIAMLWAYTKDLESDLAEQENLGKSPFLLP